MKDNENTVWENQKMRVYVKEGLAGIQLYYTIKGSNSSCGISFEEAEAIHNAVDFFKRHGVIK